MRLGGQKYLGLALPGGGGAKGQTLMQNEFEKPVSMEKVESTSRNSVMQSAPGGVHSARSGSVVKRLFGKRGGHYSPPALQNLCQTQPKAKHLCQVG